ncbi:MAG TPA: cytochrome c-type biogenesis protein CcmH [Cellvibrio sp.]|nr:cytochrome c-type biogenesis protein CcmH [Cellvibrio sp.]
MCAILIRLCTYIGLLVISVSSLAAIEVHEFDNDVDRKRYQTFIDEMRCPKCTNQNLAGTNSPIAEDLRRELVFMIKDGRSDKEIVDFMVERYGEFILYRPRLSPATILLWAAPFILLLSGVVLLLLIVRKRRRLEVETGIDTGLSSAERERLANLLNPPANKETADKANKKSKQEKK